MTMCRYGFLLPASFIEPVGVETWEFHRSVTLSNIIRERNFRTVAISLLEMGFIRDEKQYIDHIIISFLQ